VLTLRSPRPYHRRGRNVQRGAPRLRQRRQVPDITRAASMRPTRSTADPKPACRSRWFAPRTGL